jgi:hypothetical protein
MTSTQADLFKALDAAVEKVIKHLSGGPKQSDFTLFPSPRVDDALLLAEMRRRYKEATRTLPEPLLWEGDQA